MNGGGNRLEEEQIERQERCLGDRMGEQTMRGEGKMREYARGERKEESKLREGERGKENERDG